MDYIKPFGVTTAGRPAYVNGNPAAGIKGSIPDVAVWEYPLRELLAVIEAGGLTPSNGSLTQVRDAILALIAAGVSTISSGEGVAIDGSHHANLNYPGLTEEDTLSLNDLFSFYSVADAHHRKTTLSQIKAALVSDIALWHVATDAAAGSANALTATVYPSIAAYSLGTNFLVCASAANTGSATLALNGLSALPIYKPDGSPLAAGDLVSGRFYWFMYLYSGSGYFVLMSPPLTNGAAGVTPFRVMAWGRVDSTSPTIQQGSGFTVTKNAVGDVTLTFLNTPPTGFLAILSFYPLNRYGGGSPGANGWPSGSYTQSGTIVEYGRTSNKLSLQLGVSGATALYDGIFSFLILSI